MALQVIHYWLYWPVVAIFIIACLVWALMIIGAWATTVQSPGPFRHIALKKEVADKIMPTLRKAVITLIGASSLLAFNIINSFSLTDSINKTASALLSQVRGEETPLAISDSIAAIADLPSKYQQTLNAYQTFLKSQTRPDELLIEKLLPEENKRTAYDWRLLGLINDTLAEHMPEPQNTDRQITYFKKAEDFYNKALEQLRKNENHLPDNPPLKSEVEFIYRLKGAIGGIYLSLGDKEVDEKKRKQLLSNAKEIYEQIRDKAGYLPEIHLNLAAVYSSLGKYEKNENERINDYENAIKVISSAINETGLTDSDREHFLKCVCDLSKMHEYKSLVEYVKRTKHIDWNGFVEKQALTKQITSKKADVQGIH